MSRDRVVRLTPNILALVLCRVEGSREEEGDEEQGRRIFKDFQAANVKCFWNRRLVRAVSEVTFQGWLENWVLLLEGQSAELEVLRDSWVRRALRPPRGFIIRALGDVSPVQMNPISQSHFIPLAEVLCCAISDMNTTQILVTQESLMEHLNKHYPGIATPSQDILYNALGTLIRERKIYHTGEGYFIVTPQTYFITKKTALDCKYAAAEKFSTSPPPITYLVSMESCADLTKVNMPSVSHCRSCSCFSEQSLHNVLGQQSINESQVKTHRSIKEQKPSLRNQATSTSRDHYTCEKNKQQVVLKEKEKCGKKFGISLFWRNVSKKEKPRKELVSFSAQFPPEEWPVRDEDNLDNIPRDVEHEIIKRINPVLTVDNLMKHTLLMQKAEEQKKYFSKGTSTDIIKNKHGYNSKGSSKKKNGKLSKYHKKVQSSKEKCKKDTGAPRAVPHEEKDVNRLSLDQSDDDDDDVMAMDRHCYVSAEIVQHDTVYKKQISNPFDGIPYRENSNVNGHKSLKEIKRSRSGKQRRCVPRSRSLDCTERKAENIHVEHIHSERHIGAYRNEPYHEPFHSVLSDKDDLREYPPSYPQSSTLRIDDKYKPAKEDNSASVLYSEDSYICDDFQKNLFVHLEASVEHEAVKSHSIYKVTAMNSLKPNHCKSEINLNLIGRTHYGISEDSGASNACNYSNSCLKDTDMPKYNALPISETGGFTKDNKALYQRTVENDDAHRYLYLEDDTEDKTEMCPILDSHVQKANLDAVNWNDLADENKNTSGNSQSQWQPKITFAPQFGSSIDNDQKTYSPSLFSLDGSHECHKQSLHTGQPLPEYIHGHLEEEPETADCINSSEHIDGSIFDYCNSSEANSVAEALHMSVTGNDEKPVANSGQQSGELRTCFEHKLTLFHSKMNPSETSHHEKNENHSTTGDSGIESPRTRISIASNNSVVLETLKRRTFLQNLEMNGNPKHEGLLPTSSLIQITPAMNV
ncbi:storkhead-box protein 1 isoform X1 [Xenopus laevis]|uniref:Storkhead-box protein 1 isoform X1 n=3 Tax=Xenopus laevis TaxID=8355 RepID=A0A1L8FEQ6_XENLA|nr:storkhead-box protein 1 isoform X1 [Xenopus laevis]OCT70064.1 hypothetical protein XELAEV_18036985mg [Xenopus laevis]